MHADAAAGPVPSWPPMGVNVGGNMPYDTSKSWPDVAHYFRRWGPPPNSKVPVPASSLGYPLAPARTQVQLNGYPAGVYALRWRGTASWTFTGRGAVLGTATLGADGIWRAPVTFASDAGLVLIDVTGLDPADPLSDVHLIAPGYDAENPPLFTWELLRNIALFKVVRTMCWTGANDGTVREWADRVTPASCCWTSGDQVPWDVHIALANAAAKDLWITVPDLYSDDAVGQLGALLATTLDPRLNLYVESSNEPWNTKFPASKRFLAAGKTVPSVLAAVKPTDDNGITACQAAMRSVQVGRLLRQQFGEQASRVRMLLGGQSNQVYFARKGMTYLVSQGISPSAEFYGVCIGPYFGLPPAVDVAGLTLDGLFEALQENLNGVVTTGIQNHAVLAKQYGLKLLAYEAGQNVVDQRDGADIINHDVKLASQTDPRMGDLFRGLASVWASVGGDVMGWFCLTSLWDQNGSWGLLPAADSPSTPKWEAVAILALAR